MAGICKHYVDDFGEQMVSIEPSGVVEYAWKIVVSSSCLIMTKPLLQPHKASKFELLVQLVRLGWSGRTGKLASFRDGAARVLSIEMLKRSREYLITLFLVDKVFSKGILEVLHNMPQHYYMCLLWLDDSAPLLAEPNLATKPDIWFKELLENGGGFTDTALEALQDEVMTLGDAAVEMLALPAPEIAVDPAAPVMLPVLASEKERSVRFDLFSHSSGIQRAWMKCTHHTACQRWHQVNQFESKPVLVAYLSEWDKLGAIVTKAVHGSPDCVPLWEDVLTVAETLTDLKVFEQEITI